MIKQEKCFPGNVIANLGTGYHHVIWNAGCQPSDMYFYRIEAGKFAETRKTLLLK